MWRRKPIYNHATAEWAEVNTRTCIVKLIEGDPFTEKHAEVEVFQMGSLEEAMKLYDLLR